MSFTLNSKNIWETTKPLNAILDYSFDWTALHGDEGSITASVWSVDPGDGVAPTIDPLYTVINGFVTSCLIAGGTVGNSYFVRNNITLASGLVDERIFKIKINDLSI